MSAGIPFLGYVVWPGHVSAGQYLRRRYHHRLREHETHGRDRTEAIRSYRAALAHISSMLKRAIAKVNAERKKAGQPPMPSFGYRDLKGKGATDMWLAGVPIEQIQLLCGHEDKGTTEQYIKQRWRETAQPNTTKMGVA